MSNTGSFKDRSARLAVFGVIAVCVGLAGFGLGLLQLALVFAGRFLPSAEALPLDVPSAVAGTVLYGLIGAAFVLLGIGSIRKRRWVRPLMLTMAWTWLACGVLVAILAAGLLDTILLSAPGEAPMEALIMVKLLLLGLIAVAGVCLPAAFIWAYSDQDVFRTCAARNPRPAWTERAPPSVLGLSVGLGACAVAALPMLLRPVVPAFSVVLTGWPAAGALVAGCVACAYLARSTYRLEMSGWWGTAALLLLIGVATVVSFATLEPLEMYRALGYPEEQIRALVGSGPYPGRLAGWIAVVFTLLSLVYLAGIRKHFTGRDPA